MKTVNVSTAFLEVGVARSVVADGYAFLRRFEPRLTSREAFQALGLVDEVEGLRPVQTLTPQHIYDAPPNTYSGNFGVAEFPLHSDLAHWAIPPRYLALRCVCGSQVVSTRLLDGRELISALTPELLQMTLVQPRRPLRNGKQLLRILERSGTLNLWRIRWDSVYLKPANEFASNVVSKCFAVLSAARAQEIFLREPGDTLLIDNWRYLHGRSAVTAPEIQLRTIDRAYMGAFNEQ